MQFFYFFTKNCVAMVTSALLLLLRCLQSDFIDSHGVARNAFGLHDAVIQSLSSVRVHGGCAGTPEFLQLGCVLLVVHVHVNPEVNDRNCDADGLVIPSSVRPIDLNRWLSSRSASLKWLEYKMPKRRRRSDAPIVAP